MIAFYERVFVLFNLVKTFDCYLLKSSSSAMRLSLSSVSLSQYGMPDLVNRLTLFSSALSTTNTSFLAGTDTEAVDAFELKVS